MEFQQSLQCCLESVTGNASALLRHLDQVQEVPSSTPHGHALADSSIAQQREQIRDAATRLLQLVTLPSEYLEQLTTNYQELSAFRWLVHLDVLKHLPPAGQYISYPVLARQVGLPHRQLQGVCRMAVAHGLLCEPVPGHVQHTPNSLLLRESYSSWAYWLVNYSWPTALKFADATKQWGQTHAKNETAFNIALETKDSFFDYVQKRPQHTAAFANYMRNVSASGILSVQHAVDNFDWASLPPAAKVVDVGGSDGQIAIRLAQSFPHLDIVVQDLPETVRAAEASFAANPVASRVRFQSHDFFSPQPIDTRDVAVFFLRMIIHDWPDQEALVILKHLRAVLQQNPTARIVVMDTALPRPGSSSTLQERQLRARDMVMMQVFNSHEREVEEWENLFSRAGLRISHFTQPQGSVMALFTLQLAASDGPQLSTTEPDRLSELNGTSATSWQRRPILIAGAGVSGLCLGQALKRAGIPFRIFERDPAPRARAQGYRLKLSPEGSASLKDILPDQTYQAFESSCATHVLGETNIDPFTASVTRSRAGGGLYGNLGSVQTHTIDRTVFRECLLADLEEEITFGSEVLSYDLDETHDIVTATFRDGKTVQGSFLVGADGLHSVLRRRHLPSSQLVDTGATCIYGKTPITPALLATFPQRGLRWMTVVSDTAPLLQSCIIGPATVTVVIDPIRFSDTSRSEHRNLPDDYVYWAMIGPEARIGAQRQDSAGEKTRGTEICAQTAAVSLSRSLTEEWHPSVRELFELQDEKQTRAVRVISSISDIPTWESSRLVTAMGDAAHVMTPCGGAGANAAIQDAADLARLLVNTRGSPSVDDIASYEQRMRQRAQEHVQRSEVGHIRMTGLKRLAECTWWLQG